jgi:hypothetical protein
MTEQRFRDVDQLLSTWSMAQEPSQDHLDQLSADIDAGVAVQREDAHARQVRDPTNWHVSLKFIVSTAAVVALLVTAAWWIAVNDGKPTRQLASAPLREPIETITDGQRLQKQQLLAELDRLFDGKRVWFAETESDVVLGGETRPPASAIAADTAVAMRIVLAKRSSSSDPWQRVLSTDVVSRTDQVVQFQLQEPDQPTASFTSWTHLLPDGLVACDVDLKWDDGQSGELSDSLLLSPGVTQTGVSMHLNGVEYQLFQTVSLLDSITS